MNILLPLLPAILMTLPLLSLQLALLCLPNTPPLLFVLATFNLVLVA